MEVLDSIETFEKVGDLYRHFNHHYFIGREQECLTFAQALHADSAKEYWKLFNIHGPAGIGKSMLLNTFQQLARQARVPFLAFDARDLSVDQNHLLLRLCTFLGQHSIASTPTLSSCLRGLQALSEKGAFVLAVDTYEKIGPADRWLREMFLPELPRKCIFVISGRESLCASWCLEDACWYKFLQPLLLGPFTFKQTSQYLQLYGVVDDKTSRQIWILTQGHPLSVSLLTMSMSILPRALPHEITEHPETLIAEAVTRRWLREIDTPTLRTLVELAAVPRRFNEDLLSKLTSFNSNDFTQLSRLSFVQTAHDGWALHNLVRSAILHNLRRRCPVKLMQWQQKICLYYIQSALQPGNDEARCSALEDLFYLSDDGLLRAALFFNNGEISPLLTARHSDLPQVADYLHHRRFTAQDIQVDLFDQVSGKSFQHILHSHPMAPLPSLLKVAPNALHIVRGRDHHIQGLSVVVPVNLITLPCLKTDPVTGAWFANLNAMDTETYVPSDGSTRTWFIRLVDVADPNDHITRALILRNILSLLLRQPALVLAYVTSPLYRDLLIRLGFSRCLTASLTDSGSEDIFYKLDFRNQTIESYLRGYIQKRPRDDNSESPPVRLTWEQPVKPNINFEFLQNVLSNRELQIAEAVLDGKSNDEIAQCMHISVFTVKKHMTRVLDKLGIQRRTQLIKLALDHQNSRPQQSNPAVLAP